MLFFFVVYTGCPRKE